MRGKKIMIVTGILLAGIILCFGFFLLYMTFSAYRPAPVEKLALKGNPNTPSLTKNELTFFSWNIGYGGLGSHMDFFYEGGTRVRPELDEFRHYFQGIRKTIHDHCGADFIYIQEADSLAKRSYATDEPEDIAKELPGYCYAYARNYDCSFVPVPVLHPMGNVISGIATYSGFRPDTVERIAFGSRFSWPKQLFLLQRCFLLLRFHLQGGRDLVVVNTHNSTFDQDGSLRKLELKKLNSILQQEYRKGNFVIAGGDWNNNPPGFSPSAITSGDKTKVIEPPVPPDFLKGWKFVFDPDQPTNRDVNAPYHKGTTATTIIDFFVISPNVELNQVKTITVAFQFTDHQPVLMKVRLLR